MAIAGFINPEKLLEELRAALTKEMQEAAEPLIQEAAAKVTSAMRQRVLRRSEPRIRSFGFPCLSIGDAVSGSNAHLRRCERLRRGREGTPEYLAYSAAARLGVFDSRLEQVRTAMRPNPVLWVVKA